MATQSIQVKFTCHTNRMPTWQLPRVTHFGNWSSCMRSVSDCLWFFRDTISKPRHFISASIECAARLLHRKWTISKYFRWLKYLRNSVGKVQLHQPQSWVERKHEATKRFADRKQVKQLNLLEYVAEGVILDLEFKIKLFITNYCSICSFCNLNLLQIPAFFGMSSIGSIKWCPKVLVS